MRPPDNLDYPLYLLSLDMPILLRRQKKHKLTERFTREEDREVKFNLPIQLPSSTSASEAPLHAFLELHEPSPAQSPKPRAFEHTFLPSRQAESATHEVGDEDGLKLGSDDGWLEGSGEIDGVSVG